MGVSGDDVKAQKKFCDTEGLRFVVLSDPELKTAKAYDSVTNLMVAKFAARDTFLIDPNGKIARRFDGVKPSENSQQVLAAIDEMKK